MINLIDNGYGMKSALITLVIQVKGPEAYNRCLGGKAKGKLEVNSIVKGDDNQGTCFADGNDIYNDNGNDNDNDNDNQGICFADDNGNDNNNGNGNQGTCIADRNDNEKVNGNDKVNQGTCFADGNV